MTSPNISIYIRHYNNFIDSAIQQAETAGSGGKIRAINAKLVESLAELIWRTETGGDVRKEKYTIHNPKGAALDFSVDKHCYSIGGKLRLILECKTYLDRCFLARADADLHMIKKSLGKANREVEFAILALENSCADDALTFYLGNDNIDDVFFLLDGKRKSNQPIWNAKHRKPINKRQLQRFIDYVSAL